MAIKTDVQIHGLKEISRAFRGTKLYDQPYREAAEAIGALGESVAGRNAPRGDTGQLEAQITHRVQKRPIPLWIAVASRARRRSRKYPRGYFYGRVLNYSRRHGHWGWFTSPLKRLGTRVGPILTKAAQQIEDRMVRFTR